MILPPLGNSDDKVIKKCFELMADYNRNSSVSRIENVDRENLGLFKKLGLKPKPKDKEYVCLREDLVGLAGNRFKGKRSSYNYFCKNYTAEFLEYNKIMLDECLKLYKDWLNLRKEKFQDEIFQQMLEDSLVSFKCALRHYTALGLKGYVVRIDNEIKACSLGYALAKDTFCILFEICDLRLKGISQFIFREFCRRLSRYKFINIMGASDLDNLRKVKLSYHPVKEISVYNICN